MGKKIGKYQLGKTLGRGAFAKVKQATDQETNVDVAIKLIDKQQRTREHQMKRKIATSRSLNHPNIERVVEVLQTEKHVYIVSELCNGGELFDKIVEAKQLDSRTARRYFRQLILGVQYAHQLGTAHGKLKPENILLDDQDNIKITGFGEADHHQEGFSDYPLSFSDLPDPRAPNFDAPELLTGKVVVDRRAADVWSCGVILFVMLAGYLPFDDPNLMTLFRKIDGGEYQMGSSFSDVEKDLIGKMLIVDPTKRITLDEILAHPWLRDTAIQHSPVVQQCIAAHLVPADLVDHCCGFMQPDDFPIIRSTSEDTEETK